MAIPAKRWTDDRSGLGRQHHRRRHLSRPVAGLARSCATATLAPILVYLWPYSSNKQNLKIGVRLDLDRREGREPGRLICSRATTSWRPGHDLRTQGPRIADATSTERNAIMVGLAAPSWDALAKGDIMGGNTDQAQIGKAPGEAASFV